MKGLCRGFYWLLVLMVGTMWFGGYRLLWGVAVTKPEMIVGDPTRGVYESSLSTYEATMGAHLFLSLLVFIIATVSTLLALGFWWQGFHKISPRATQFLVIGMVVILFPLPFIGPSAIKTLPYTGEIYKAVQYHKAPVTIHFNPDGSHVIKPME